MSIEQTHRVSRRARVGFTLLELVVAVAVVIATVAALLPAMSQARVQALKSSCLANQRVLGVGTAQYVQSYQQLPGIQWHEGNYWTKPWGQNYFYGGYLSWMTNGLDFSNDFLYADIYPYATSPNPNAPSGYAGLGAVTAYVGNDGKAFYCPGTAASFTATSIGAPRYETWTGTPGDHYHGFGQQGRGTETTYFYRSGMYDKQDLPDNDPRWAEGNANWNWTRDTLVHPTDTFVQNKPMLTCFWHGVRPRPGQEYWPEWPDDAPFMDTVPHNGTSTNLLYTDGSARTWRLEQVSPSISSIWAWFDAGAYTKSQFHTGSAGAGFDMSVPNGDFYSQLPWWWVEAERANP